MINVNRLSINYSKNIFITNMYIEPKTKAKLKKLFFFYEKRHTTMPTEHLEVSNVGERF